MNRVHLPRVDLNLLVVFDALIAEGNATRAGDRIGLTQPAVSHALNRLRALFGDPLFVRAPRGMVPTPTALDVAPHVRSILEGVERVLGQDRRFEPRSSTRQFVLGLSDYAAFVLLPDLTARVEREAPGATLVVRNTARDIGLAMLEDDRAEVIVGNFPPPPPHMREALLYEEDFVCAARRGHPAFAGGLDLETYLGVRHLQVSTKGEPHGLLDDLLREYGVRRTVAVTVGHFLMAPLLIENGDLVATEPRRLFASRADRPLAIAEPPLPIPPFRIVQAWHARYDADPGHLWLRGLLGKIAATV